MVYKNLYYDLNPVTHQCFDLFFLLYYLMQNPWRKR